MKVLVTGVTRNAGLAVIHGLELAREKIQNTFGPSVIEEYIPGGAECMRTVNVLFDAGGRLAAYFTTRKVRQWPPTGGISAMSISTDDWQLMEMVMPFFEKWRWAGPAEVEIKIDARDNKPKLIEINPRFWSYISFPIKCGVNFPAILCGLAAGSRTAAPPYPKYTQGAVYINPSAFREIGGCR